LNNPNSLSAVYAASDNSSCDRLATRRNVRLPELLGHKERIARKPEEIAARRDGDGLGGEGTGRSGCYAGHGISADADRGAND
jgi:hypothetical protein